MLHYYLILLHPFMVPTPLVLLDLAEKRHDLHELFCWQADSVGPRARALERYSLGTGEGARHSSKYAEISNRNLHAFLLFSIANTILRWGLVYEARMREAPPAIRLLEAHPRFASSCTPTSPGGNARC